MIRRIHSLVAALLLLSPLVMLDLAASQDSREALSFSNLRLRASTADRELALLEPVPVTLTMSNETRRPILGHSDIGFSSGHIEAFVRHEDGRVVKVERLSGVVAHVLVSKQRLIPAGARYTATELMSLDLDSVFPGAGVYQMYFQVHDTERREVLRSNPVVVRVAQPQGLDLAAYDYIMTSGEASQVFSGLGLAQGENTRQVLEELVRSYGGTRYADYASLSLGQFFFYTKDYPRALEQLMKIQDREAFPLAKQAAEYVAKTRSAMKL